MNCDCANRIIIYREAINITYGKMSFQLGLKPFQGLPCLLELMISDCVCLLRCPYLFKAHSVPHPIPVIQESLDNVLWINTEERLPNFRVSVTGFGFRGPVGIFASRSSVLILFFKVFRRYIMATNQWHPPPLVSK